MTRYDAIVFGTGAGERLRPMSSPFRAFRSLLWRRALGEP
jgi:hypothetical protein